MKIIWHIAFLNHWLEITLSQFRCIVESGLYDEVADIYVSVLGEKEELKTLRDIFEAFPKIKIVRHSEDVSEKEFPTLKYLQDSCNGDDFYGLYLHSKGASWSKEKSIQAYMGGTKWRNYMMYYNVTRWKDCVKNLDLGYELCGVKLLSPRHSPAEKTHYSGNFFWFRSEYVKDLPKIETLNHDDRYAAEMWVCSNSPIAATLCQEFIDYNSKGIFVAPK